MKTLPLIPAILFFLLTVFSAVPGSLAATVEVKYEDRGVKGFYDETPLTEEEKEIYSRYGNNNAETLGELRRNAFKHAADLLASKLASDNIIRINAVFADLKEGSRCYDGGAFVWANVFFLDRLEENRRGFGVSHPIALAEALSGRELNGQNPDMEVRFGGTCGGFHYAFENHRTFITYESRKIEHAHYEEGVEEYPHGSFVLTALHEIIHGLGITSHIASYSGNNDHFLGREFYNLRILEKDERGSHFAFVLWEEGYGYSRGSTISSLTGVSIYDVQMYSKEDEELLIHLSESQRKAAMTSDGGLLWEGTDEGRNPCSYGQRMAELQPDSVRSQDGKPKLHVSTIKVIPGRTAAHPHYTARDIMSTSVENMDLSLGMLKDIGWEIIDEGFPPSCVPTGITVTPTSGLVTTEEGRMASFTVKLDSEPMSDVIIPVRSTDLSEGAATPQALEFTTENWDVEQTVTVEGVNDNEPDGSRNYVIELKEVQSDDRFYSDFDPQDVTLTNEEEVLDVLVSFDVARATVEEGKAGTTITVTLSTDPERTVAVPITITHGGGATADDYSGVPQNLGFAAGETSRSFTFTAEDDSVDDDGESVVLGFGALPEGVSAGIRDRITVTILDNDEPESGGGGCTIAAEAEHGAGNAAVNLLLMTTVLFSILFRKSRLTNQPRYCKSR